MNQLDNQQSQYRASDLLKVIGSNYHRILFDLDSSFNEPFNRFISRDFGLGSPVRAVTDSVSRPSNQDKE